MRNRVAYNCKTIKHRVLLYLTSLVCCLVFTNSLAASSSINIYLKLKSTNKVSSLIKNFNQFLGKNQIITSFQIRPFLNDYPLHITLYLAEFDKNQIPDILKKVALLSRKQQPIRLYTNSFNVHPTAYVMLSVDKNKKLAQLSQSALYALMNLRNKEARTPAWVAQDEQRQNLFNQYGSPGVLNYFNPHFSVFNPVHLNQKQRTKLYEQLLQLIAQYNSSHQTQVVITAYALGVGIANAQGQIIKELGTFALH